MRNIFALLLLMLSACRPAIEVDVVRADAGVIVDDEDPVTAPEEAPPPAEEVPVEIDEDVTAEPPIDDVTDPTEPENDPAFIGAACTQDSGCLAGGFCFVDDEGFVSGTCSLSCTRLCPDQVGAPVSFCVDDPLGSDDGVCLSRCDVDIFGGDGCRDGYRCEQRPRHADDTVVRGVCWPDDLPIPADNDHDDDDDEQEDEPGDDVCDDDTLPLDNAGIVEPDGVGGCPAGMAPVDAATCMDRWEAFVDVVTADGGTAPWSPYATPGTVDVVARSAPGAVPQGYISGTQAARACGNAGKRLCRRAEHQLACRSASGFTYPWGNDRRDGVCNDARAVHPAVEYFGTGASWIWSRLDHPCINQVDDGLARTGSHEGCVGFAGHFDLMGNLHEWIDDGAGTFVGGFYVDTVRNGAGCLYATTAHDVSHRDYSTGFRCCADR